MRFRKKPAPLILLLIPAFASALAIQPKEKDVSANLVRAAEKAPEYPPASDMPPLSPSLKTDIGTKDAPVDGLDGKPHKGPFVLESSEEKKKSSSATEAAVSSKQTAGPSSDPKKDKSTPVDDEGVMDDRNHLPPKKGTTGTEGGVSEKDRDRKAQEAQTGAPVEKIPEPPKEVPPSSNSEQERLSPKKDKDKGVKVEKETEKPKGAAGLEKPADLPDTPHDIPHPVPPSLPKDDESETEEPKKTTDPSTPLLDETDASGVIQPFHSFVLSLTMILFSEVGDKTFLVAALMAMRHPRLVVFSAAFSALIAMTVLSAVLGHAVPTLIPKRYTNFLAALLFLVFGAKMLREGLAMSPHEGVGEEMKEVEAELEEKEHLARRNSRRRSSISPYVLEAGRVRRSRSNSRLPAPPRSPSSSPSRSPSPSRSSITELLIGLNNLLSLLLSPAWVQTFVMTFLGEWGDRSQIATIAMAAGQDYWWVTSGAIGGHAVCTGAAVIGGRAIAGRVSMRVVTLGGAFAFLAFGIIYLLEAAYSG